MRVEGTWVKQLQGMVSSGFISPGPYPDDSPPVGRVEHLKAQALTSLLFHDSILTHNTMSSQIVYTPGGGLCQAMLNFQHFVQVLCLVLILRTQVESGETVISD